MSSVQFPDPNQTNPETGNPYGDGWTADNGFTYVYKNTVWKADRFDVPSADAIKEQQTIIDALIARVDARDAIIADLTARIQTLEGGNN